MARIAIVIPTFQEAENIVVLIKDLRQTIGNEAQIIVVDDASPDGTAAAVEALGDHGVTVIKRAGKLGLGSAYREGFAKALADADCEFVVQMDADLSHDPNYLLDMLPLAEQNDLVIGSRYIDGGAIAGWSLWRHFCSRSAMTFSRLLLGLQAHDVTSGYRIWRADLLRRVLAQNVKSDGYAFQEEMLWRAQKLQARIVETPILFADRRHGHSKLHLRDVIEFFIIMIRLRFS